MIIQIGCLTRFTGVSHQQESVLGQAVSKSFRQFSSAGISWIPERIRTVGICMIGEEVA